MKNLLLGLCLVGLTFACKSSDNLSVDDAQDPNMPAVECGSDSDCCATECSGAEAAECAAEKAECSASKAECSASKAECSGDAPAECSGDAPAGCSGAKPEGAVCPVTGKPVN